MWQEQGLDLTYNNFYPNPQQYSDSKPPITLGDMKTPRRGNVDPLLGLITPESPTSNKIINLEKKNDDVEFKSPENNPPTIFRPWDTPESLSPTSDNISPASDHISPTSSNLYVSPTSSSGISPSYTTISIVPSTPDLASNQTEFQFASNNIPPPAIMESPISSSFLALYGPCPLLPPTKRKLENIGASPNLTKRQKPEPPFTISGPSKSRPTSTPPPLTSPSNATPSGKKPGSGSRRTGSGGRRASGTPCGVCGVPSTGFHYGASVCEGCKGFFRRRVVYKDIHKLTCGVGNMCRLEGRNRIHCKLCRWMKCLYIGMNPSSVKAEGKLNLANLSFEDQILALHRDTMLPVPTLYLGRQHAKNLISCLATSLPATADVSPACINQSYLFISQLPGFENLDADQQAHLSSTGTCLVGFLRFLSRYRPEVNAFLFPSGEFLMSSQLDLQEKQASDLTLVATEMCENGLTELEIGLLSVLVACDPIDPPPIYSQVIQFLEESLSRNASWELLTFLISIQDLFFSDPNSWMNLSLKQ